MVLEKSDSVLHSIEMNSKKHVLPILGRKKGTLLRELILKHKPKKILEIGTLVGYSAIVMADAAEKDAKITTIELNVSLSETSKKNIAKAGLSNMITVINANALQKIPELQENYDFIFIDGAKQEYIKYIQLLEEKNMHTGTIVVADNVKMFADDCADYLEYVRSSGKYDSRTHDFDFDAMEISVRK